VPGLVDAALLCDCLRVGRSVLLGVHPTAGRVTRAQHVLLVEVAFERLLVSDQTGFEKLVKLLEDTHVEVLVEHVLEFEFVFKGECQAVDDRERGVDREHVVAVLNSLLLEFGSPEVLLLIQIGHVLLVDFVEY